MKVFEIAQKISKNFLIIFASVIIMITLLRQMYDPNLAFDLKSIYIVMAFSFISALIGSFLYSPTDSSENNKWIRIVIQFLTLEILLIALAIVLDIVTRARDGFILALQIAVIFIIVRLLSWNKDKKDAQKINGKLQALKKNI